MMVQIHKSTKTPRPSGGELDYACAKAQAILGRSFCAGRMEPVLRCRNLSDFALLVFPGRDFHLPEKLLVRALQDELEKRCLDDILRVCRVFDSVPDLLLRHIEGIECLWIKHALNAQAHGESVPPAPDLGTCGRLNHARWPDLKRMVAGTPWAWLPPSPRPQDLRPIECRLDHQFHNAVLDAVDASQGLSANEALGKTVREAMALRNVAWALRMSLYYRWPREKALPWLVGRDHGCAAQALAVFDLPAGNPSAWAEWGYARFLPDPGAGWQPDPMVFEQKSAPWLYRRFWHLFHASPLETASLYAFCRLKEFEAQALSSIAEGFLLGMPLSRMRELVEMSS